MYEHTKSGRNGPDIKKGGSKIIKKELKYKNLLDKFI